MAASVRCSFPNIESRPGSHLVCEAGAAGLTVFSDLNAVRRLETEAIEAFTALPKRGLEIGGLLLGRTEADGRIIIEDYEPIPSEHRRGPSYLLSEKDKQLFRERIVHWKTAGRLSIIGLYRSNTRTGFAPGQEDVALLAEHCPAGQGLFLLVQPALGKPSTARLFVGNGWSDQGFKFTLHPSELASGRVRLVEAIGHVGGPVPVEAPPAIKPLVRLADAAQVAESSATCPLPEQVTENQQSGRTIRKTIRSSRLAAALAAVLIMATGLLGLLTWRSSRHGLEAKPAPIGLTIGWSDGSLHLRWDRNSPVISQAKRGIVWIVDGQRRQLMLLDSRQLQQGSIQYWPESRNVEFQLQLVTPTYRASESVTAAHVPEPVLAGPQAVIPNASVGARVSAQPQSAPPSSAAQPPSAATPRP